MCPCMPGTADRPGKRILFFSLCPLPSSLSLFHSWPMGRWQKQEGAGGGGAWQTGSEQWVEKDADVKAMNLWKPVCIPPFLPFPHTTPPSSPSISPSSLPSLFFNCTAQTVTIAIMANQHSCPLLLPGPRNYLLASLIRERLNDKCAVCVCKYACAQSLGVMTLAGSRAGSD